MSVSGIGPVNLSQLAQLYQQQVMNGTTGPTAAGLTGGTDPAAATRGADFAGAIGQSLQQVGTLDANAASKAVQAATGNLNDVHDYVIAATQAQVATELTTTVRNKALDSFNEIMRMPL